MANYSNEADFMRLDAQRKKILLYMILGTIPLPATFVTVFLFVALGYGDKIPDCIILAFIAAFALTVVFSTMFKKNKILFNRDYKSTLVNRVLYSNFDNFNYQPEMCIPKNEIMLLTKDQSFYYDGEDLITGVYKGVQYRQSDVYVYDIRGNGKNRRKVVLMDGRLASFFYPKCQNAVVVVAEKGMPEVNTYGLEQVQMESTEFNKKFRVYANDQQMAFYLLTPQVMEYLQRLSRNCVLLVRFHNGVVYVMRHRVKGVFDVNFCTKMDLNQEARNAVNDMKELLEIIDILKLDKA